MNFSPKKMVAGAVLVIVALGLFLVIKPDNSKDTDPGSQRPPAATTGAPGTTPTVPGKKKRPAPSRGPSGPVVEVKGGQPVGGVQKLDVNEGGDVRFTVKSDVDEEVHVHGFDVSKPVGPGKPARFDFEAGFTGIFEVELENSAVPIIELQVNP